MYGPLLERLLRKKQEEKPSLELSKRIDRLLKAIESAPSQTHLQQLRAVELLESIATPEALKLLDALGKGADSAELTARARAAADRLRRR
jgi:hypothetical protein